MAVQFYEKLDFLMRLTNTTNSALSLHIKLDASHISRLRRGQRSPVRDAACVKSMAAYFSKVCKEAYQRKAVAETLKIGADAAADGAALSEHIANWLIAEKDEAAAGPTKYGARHAAPEPYPQAGISIYYGVEGKRQAAACFLAEVIAQSRPQTLLLFSDEATDWMTEDRAFAEHWAALMKQLLAKGNKIKIIHTVSRDLDEMLAAVHQWVPLYMTGQIEPYFCPKKRDGIFRRTLFLAPGVSAVVSSSVGNSIDHAPNMLIRNSGMIGAYTEEFQRYLSLCRPLMRMYTEKDREAYLETLMDYETEKSNSLVETESLSVLTMPAPVLSAIAARIGGKGTDSSALQETMRRLFERNLKSNTYTELVPLFDAKQVESGTVKVAFSEMLLGGAAWYTPEEYILHLEHLVRLLENYENFHIHLIREEPEPRYMICAREELGVIVAKTSAPPVALVAKEANLAAVFWEFLQSMIGGKAPDNAEAAGKLRDYNRRLRRSAD